MPRLSVAWCWSMPADSKIAEDASQDVHVMHVETMERFRFFEHECTNDCVCEPELSYVDYFTERKVWLHHRIQ